MNNRDCHCTCTRTWPMPRLRFSGSLRRTHAMPAKFLFASVRQGPQLHHLPRPTPNHVCGVVEQRLKHSPAMEARSASHAIAATSASVAALVETRRSERKWPELWFTRAKKLCGKKESMKKGSKKAVKNLVKGNPDRLSDYVSPIRCLRVSGSFRFGID